MPTLARRGQPPIPIEQAMFDYPLMLRSSIGPFAASPLLGAWKSEADVRPWIRFSSTSALPASPLDLDASQPFAGLCE